MPFPTPKKRENGSVKMHSHRTDRTAPTRTTTVLPPYRAEKRDKSGTVIESGVWRDEVCDAMADGRRMGSGTRVMSKNNVVLAKFENAARFITPAAGRPATRLEKAGT
jgi:hypothetical protein